MPGNRRFQEVLQEVILTQSGILFRQAMRDRIHSGKETATDLLQLAKSGGKQFVRGVSGRTFKQNLDWGIEGLKGGVEKARAVPLIVAGAVSDFRTEFDKLPTLERKAELATLTALHASSLGLGFLLGVQVPQWSLRIGLGGKADEILLQRAPLLFAEIFVDWGELVLSRVTAHPSLDSDGMERAKKLKEVVTRLKSGLEHGSQLRHFTGESLRFLKRFRKSSVNLSLNERAYLLADYFFATVLNLSHSDSEKK